MRIKRSTVFVLAIGFALAGCQKRTRVAALPPPPPPAVTAFDQAERAFAAGNYQEAARAYESYLQLTPDGGKRDEALFRLALAYALPENPNHDWRRATTWLKQLVDQFPQSPFKPPARLILALHSEVGELTADTQKREQRMRQLSTELDKLKKIDAERRRRP